MAELTATVRPTREEVVPSRKRVKLPAWLEVAKPRLIPLLLATTLGGMALSEGWPLSSPRLVCTLGGGALASAAAGVLNCLWEQDLDGRMARTSGRALPSGRLSPTSAFIGAIACTLAAAMLLVSGVNCLAAGLSLLGLCSYVLLYTALLKPRTSQNIVIGGVAGAIPPLVGAAAAQSKPPGPLKFPTLLPPWEPEWVLNRSTIAQPCNYSGWFDVDLAAQFGVVSFDWANHENSYRSRAFDLPGAPVYPDDEDLVTQAHAASPSSGRYLFMPLLRT